MTLALATGPSVLAAGPLVNVWVTSPDGALLLHRRPSVRFTPTTPSAAVTIDVDDGIAYQTVEGFGASLTDSSAALLWNLPAPERTAVLKSLFDPREGIGLSVLRQPMGASDFSTIGSYSYDDRPEGETDPELQHFTIAHDLEYIVPELREIRAINPRLKIIASPWSPPAWMKTSGSMIGGTLCPDAYSAWAAYFVKFIEAYRLHGLDVDYVTLQNEPQNIPADYPGMAMDAAQQATLLRDYLGPAFARAGVSPKILGWDHNWSNSYPYEVLKDDAVRRLAAGTAWHCYGGSVESQSDLDDLFPGQEHWETECSGFAGSSFAQDLRYVVQTLIIGVLRHGGRGVLRWNLALDETHGPRHGGCANCTALVTIDSRTGAVTRNVDYYSLAHASHFVAPGAVRIASSDGAAGVGNVAFLNADGSRVLVAFNDAPHAQSLGVSWQRQSFRFRLPAGAAVTFRWNGGPAPPRAATPATRAAFAASPPNLAAARPVTASSTEKEGTEATLAVDGNGLTRWSSAFSDPQWIAVDLGAPADIGRVWLKWESACGKAYQIQVSDDALRWTTLVDVTDGREGVQAFDVAGRGRFVRVYGTERRTEYGYSLWELEVYGPRPTSTQAATVSATH